MACRRRTNYPEWNIKQHIQFTCAFRFHSCAEGHVIASITSKLNTYSPIRSYFSSLLNYSYLAPEANSMPIRHSIYIFGRENHNTYDRRKNLQLDSESNSVLMTVR